MKRKNGLKDVSAGTEEMNGGRVKKVFDGPRPSPALQLANCGCIHHEMLSYEGSAPDFSLMLIRGRKYISRMGVRDGMLIRLVLLPGCMNVEPGCTVKRSLCRQ